MTRIQSIIAALAAATLLSSPVASASVAEPVAPAASAPSTPAPAAGTPATPPARTVTGSKLPKRIRPALWLLRDRDTRIWLFGTVHVLPKGVNWIDPPIEQAVRSADTLVLELPPTDGDAATQVAGLVMAMATDGPPQPPLLDRVPADKRAQLAALVKQSGVPPQVLDRMETWSAAFLLTAAQFQSMGLAEAKGVEDRLTTLFHARHRPIDGLETSRQQLGYFDTLSEEGQRAFLLSILGEQADLVGEFEEMLGAWARGDEQAIAANFDKETTLSPELRKVLLHDRNARWTDWIAGRMKQPGRVMIAVGAGHLAGHESVIAMLKAKGFRVTRVQ